MEEKEIFARLRLLLGESGARCISALRIIVFGVGGVGSWCAESLVRSGVRELTIVDPDTVNVTNINRQLMATTSTVGLYKVDVLKERLQDINPHAKISTLKDRYCSETADRFKLESYDVVVDAIDSLKDKKLLILNATSSGARLYSSMGAARKIDPSQIKVADFKDVYGDPLGRMLRKGMRQEGTFPEKPFKCVFSPEAMECEGLGSMVHVTAVFGLTLTGEIIKDTLNA